MKILVTGGAGFIGSHIAERYIANGHDVVIVDNLSSGKAEYIHPSAAFYQVDILDRQAMEEVFAKERPEIVNHHAAQKSVPKSVSDPILDAEINIIGLLNLLMLAVKYRARRFISVSSGGALAGDARQIPTTESSEVHLRSPYAISKYISEKYLHFFAVTYRLTYVVLRYANVYGPRQTPDGECGIVPIFMKNLMSDRHSILMTYPDMPRGCTRDYVFVEDVCDANLSALTRGDNEIFNIGSSLEVDLVELYTLIQEITGQSKPLIRQGERIGDVRRSSLDSDKARRQLDWRATTGLRAGLQKTYDWLISTILE